MALNGDVTLNGVPHFQVSFFSRDSRFSVIPDLAINVPSPVTHEKLNALVNETIKQTEDDWNDVDFDFLIDGVLLRTELGEFAQDHGVSLENLIRVECIVREPPPQPDQDIPESDWVADVVTTPKYIISVNYGGEVNVWSHKGSKVGTWKADDEPLKCIEVVNIGEELHIAVGSQNQTITLCRLEEAKKAANVVPIMVFRGHERSVECIAAKADGTRLVSGSFDKCLKVWNAENDDSNVYAPTNEESTKKRKHMHTTKTPMVTLESHREAITGVEWNPLNDKQVVTASWDHSLITWDLELAGPVATLNSNKSFTSVALSPSSGLAITGSVDPQVRLWDLRSREGSMVKQSFLGHRGWVSAVSWAPDKDHLFVSASFDNSVKMWDVRSPKASLYDLIGHEDRALAVDWSFEPLIASGAADSTVKTFRRS